MPYHFLKAYGSFTIGILGFLKPQFEVYGAPVNEALDLCSLK